MKINIITHWGLVGACVAAILYLFFSQARLAMQPVPIVFEPTQLAYGYTVSTFTGTVYHDEGVTPVGAGSGVTMYVNGTSTGTVTTDVNGLYTFENKTIQVDDVVTVYLDGEPENAVLVSKFSASEIADELITGMDLYHDRLILRTSTGGNLSVTETDLRGVGKIGDDVSEIFTATGGVLLTQNSEFFVWDATTYTASGSLRTHDLDVRGTFDADSNSITASGSFVVSGTLSSPGTVTLSSYSSGETLQVNSSSLENLYVDSGIEAYFRMDEGTGLNASGATLSTATGGSLTNGAHWVATTTGTTLYFNPHAIEFDGTDDYVHFGDAYDISDGQRKTFSTWFRRKSTDTEDVIFAKKNGSGSSTTGYMLYIDDTSDKVYFEVANGTNNYLVESASSITDQDWHHVAVSYNPMDTTDLNIFLDGSIDVGSKSGSLETSGAISGTFSNAANFVVGADSDISFDEAFHGTIDDLRIYTRSMSGTVVARLAAGQKSTGSGTYNLRSDIDINGDISLFAGRIDVGTGYTLTVGGDIRAMAGELQSNSGSVTLDGTSQYIYGTSIFNRLIKTVSSADTLTLEANARQILSGSLTIQGVSSNRLTLKTTRTGSQSYLRVDNSGTTVLKHLNVIDNNATGGLLLSCTAGCVDNGNNINWEFLNECGDGVIGGSEQCDDGDSDNFDVCPNDCQFPVCGDDIVEGLEECEPPNAGACKSNCLFRTGGGGGGTSGGDGGTDTGGPYYKRPEPPEGCGDGVIDEDKGEECDEGRFNDLGHCSYDCKKRFCGDGDITPAIGEDCEPTVKGTRNGKKIFEVPTCGESCTVPQYTSTGTEYGGCKTKFLPACGSNQTPGSKGVRKGVCGNGIVESGEECDFGGICTGGQLNGTVTTNASSVEACVAQGGRFSPVSGDGCTDTCRAEFCGDGALQQRGADNQLGTSDDEQCDNGSVCSNDTQITCRLDSDCAGDGVCVYNAERNPLCSDSCQMEGRPAAPPPQSTQPEPSCGDGIVQGDEQCDDGTANSDLDPNACRTDCTVSMCGDFVVDEGEECDSGTGNSDTRTDACRLDCTAPMCGDGVVDFNEQCDGGLGCQENCIFASAFGQCGNGIVERGEQCDDGGNFSGDGCSRFCQFEYPEFIPSVCGNGEVEQGEQCDDGNTYNKDGCSNSCINEVVIQTGFNLDADIVIVNPTKIANALKFIPGDSPCATLVVKGLDGEADSIRNAAKKQGITVLQNITLARSIYNAFEAGDEISNGLCNQINLLKPDRPSAPEVDDEPIEIIFEAEVPDQPTIPEDPMLTADISDDSPTHAPVGDTGPATAAILVSGIAGGAAWIRKKRRV